MKRIFSVFLGLMLLVASGFVFAQAKEYDDIQKYTGENSFSSIVDNVIAEATKQYGNWQTAAPHVLIVLDVDNTLLTMPQFLGGVAWFNWQETLLGTTNPQHVAKNFTNLLLAQRLLFVMNKMALTDAYIPNTLSIYARSGIHIIIDSARGPEYSSLTDHQLMDARIVGKGGNSTLFAQYGLKDPNYNSTTYSAELSCKDANGKTFTRPVSYVNGALYLSGQDKGVGLECLQDALGYANVSDPSKRQYTYIIFMDDLQKNLRAVMAEYKNVKNIELDAVHFTKDQNRDVLPADPAQAAQLKQKATIEYNSIYNTLADSLIDPDLPEK